MEVLVSFFSYTGRVATLAEAVRREMSPRAAVTLQRIVPVADPGYLGWLARSCVPGWCSPIRTAITDVSPYDLIFLGFPKWTLACPPVNQYLRALEKARGRRFALFMAFGGFDQERFMRQMIARVRRLGGEVVAAEKVRRGTIALQGHLPMVRDFCRQALRACG